MTNSSTTDIYQSIHSLLSYRQLSFNASDKTLLENTIKMESVSSALIPLAYPSGIYNILLSSADK